MASLSSRRVTGILTATVLLTGLLTGCSKELKINPEAYRGPALTSEAETGKHLVVATLPSPGWQVEIDATRETADGTDVYITLRRPNPAGVYTQQLVTQRVLTTVDAGEAITVLARIADYSEESEAAYRRAD